ncbi:MAG: SGNH/GDSL hydrolase family protein [Deltaproteobacteria bacterium]|nr:SGNH/GDSL hydrolase family protein [Deltaproteobacteria bacterium]
MIRRSLAVHIAAAALLVACGDEDAASPDATVLDGAPLPDGGPHLDGTSEAPDVVRPPFDGAAPIDDATIDDATTSVDAFVADTGPETPDADLGMPELDAEPPVDAFVPPADSGLPGDFLRFVPAIDSATKARLRAIVASGAAAGLRPDVFSKIGDSITESASFGWDFGHGWVAYGRYDGLAGTLERFSRVIVDDREEPLNSWSAHSLCATAGWTTADALGSGAASPLDAELDRTRGAFAIVMYGTNDLERLSEGTYETNLRAIVGQILARDTVVVLSTIPPRTDGATFAARVERYNAIVREVAADTGALLLDYHGACSGLPSFGISADGVHPNVAPGDPGAGDLRDPALAYGYNVRNLLWLLTVDRLARVVLDDGPPEG